MGLKGSPEEAGEGDVGPAVWPGASALQASCSSHPTSLPQRREEEASWLPFPGASRSPCSQLPAHFSVSSWLPLPVSERTDHSLILNCCPSHLAPGTRQPACRGLVGVRAPWGVASWEGLFVPGRVAQVRGWLYGAIWKMCMGGPS